MAVGRPALKHRGSQASYAARITDPGRALDRAADPGVRAGSWGIIGCCLAGLATGVAVSASLSHASDAVRMVAIGGAARSVTFALLALWQGITPRAVIAAIRG